MKKRYALPVVATLFGALLCGGARVVVGATIEPGTIPKVAGKAEQYNLQGQRWRLGRKPVPELQRPKHAPIFLDEVVMSEIAIGTSQSMLRPELILQSGHSLKISDIALSPNGSWMVTAGGYDQTLRLWDLASSCELRSISAHTGKISAVAISPDGKLLASGANDGTAKIWDVQSGKLIRVLKVDPYASLEFTARLMGDVNDLDFSPDGRHIALATDEDPRIIEVRTGKEVRPLRGHENDVISIRYSPDGSLIATEASDLRLWDAGTGKQLRVIEKQGLLGRGIAFSPDSKLIAAIVREKNVAKATVWRVASGKKLFTVEDNASKRKKRPLAVKFSADGTSLAVSFANRIRFVDVEFGKDLFEIFRDGLEATSLEFGKRDNTIYFANGRSAEKWDLARKVRLAEFSGKIAPMIAVSVDNEQRFLYSIFAPDGTANESQRTGLFWDLEMGGVRRLGPPVNSKNQARAIGKSHDRVLAGYIEGTLRVWDGSEGRLLNEIVAHPKPVQSVAIDDQGSVVATGSDDHTVSLWDAVTLTRLKTLEGHTGLVNSLDFSDDGRLLASSSSDHTVRVWSVPDGRLLQTLKHDEWVHKVIISPDGRWVATAQSFISGRQLKLWDMQENVLAYLLLDPDSSWGSGLAFTPDSKTLAMGRSDQSVTLWDIGTDNFRRTVPHSNSVNSIFFSTDGALMFTASADGSVAISETASGRVLARLIAVAGTADWVAVTPDGMFDGTPAAWSLLAWRFRGNTFDTAPAESFVNEFFYPGLITEILQGRYPAAPANIAEIDRRQPSLDLSITGANESGDIAARTVTVNVRVQETRPDQKHPEGSGARDVRLFRNGTLVKVWRGDVLDTAGTAMLSADVPLVAGPNRLQAYAFSNNNIKSADAVLEVVGAQALSRQGRLVLVAVGINEYDNGDFNLSYAVTDVDAFVDEVQSQQQKLGKFSDIDIVRLVDTSATKKNILAALESLSSLQPEDALMVYYAGHGTTDGDRFYMLPHDLGYSGRRAELDQLGFDTMLQHGISDQELASAFERIDTGESLLFIDACNSGQALETGEKRRGPMNAKGLAQLAYDKGMNIITAAQGFQLANEHSALGHGFLTYALVEEGLKTDEADLAPQNSEVTIREWLDFSAARVPEIHAALLRQSTRGLGKKVRAAAVDEQESWELQQPRVFYRREAGAEGFVVAIPSR